MRWWRMRLTGKQIEIIKAEAEKYKEAIAKAGRAEVDLWQACIDIAIAAREVDISFVFSSPVAAN
jgi:hypothetical protein